MLCESCMRHGTNVQVKFDDGDVFNLCAECASVIQEGGILEALNRIRHWRTGSFATA